MDKEHVSIIMATYNGEAFIAEAIESLLAQDYENIEIIILDNISTDRTREICQHYVNRDKRVRYICDIIQCNGVDGQKRAAAYARGEFLMIACDDDVYASTYINSLMKIMKSDPTVGLAFSAFNHIYPDGLKEPYALKKRYFLKSKNSRFYNFAFYLLHRFPVPTIFGLMRTDIHKKALPYYYYVDDRGGDHDNLYVLRLLSLAKVGSTEDALFYYRQRDRLYTWPTGLSQKPLKKYVGQTKHQILVSKAIMKIIDESSFSRAQKIILQCFNFIVLLFNCTVKYFTQSLLYRWLRNVPA